MMLQTESMSKRASLTRDEVFRIANEMHSRMKSIYVKYNFTSKTLLQLPTGRTLDSSSREVEFATLGERRLIRTTTAPNEVTTLVFDGDISHSLGRGVLRQTTGKLHGIDKAMYVSEALHFPLTDTDRINKDNEWFYPHVLRSIDGASPYNVLPALELVDDAWCHVLEYPGRDKLWVDGNAGCALRRRVRSEVVNEQSIPVVRYHYSDLREADQGIWIPMNVRRELFASGRNPPAYWGRVHMEDRTNVVAAKFNQVSSDDFNIPIPPGTIVISPTGENSRIPGRDPVALNDIVTAAQGILPPSTRKWWVVFLNLLALVVLLMIGFVLHRRMKRHASR